MKPIKTNQYKIQVNNEIWENKYTVGKQSKQLEIILDYLILKIYFFYDLIRKIDKYC
jgi:hypothetical protein